MKINEMENHAGANIVIKTNISHAKVRFTFTVYKQKMEKKT